MEKRKNDEELIQNIKGSNCEESLKELMERHSPLCFDVYRKYAAAMTSSGICIDFSFGDKDLIIYKSALSFKPQKKTKFSTWLANQVRYYCLNLMNKNDLIPTEEKIMNYYLNQGESSLSYGTKIKENLDYIYNILDQVRDKRIKEIFTLRYFYNPNKKAPWALIAKNVGISTQTAINLHNKGIKILRKKVRSSSELSVDII